MLDLLGGRRSLRYANEEFLRLAGPRQLLVQVRMSKSAIPDATVRNQQLVAVRRKAIVDAAVEILTSKGFSATRTQEIALRAEVTQGTLYNYIRTKEDILYLICDEIASARSTALDAALKKDLPPYEQLVEVLRSMIGTYFQYPAHSAIVFRETHLLPEPVRNRMRERFASHIDRVQQVLVEASEAQICDITDVHLAANMITFLPSVLALRSWYADHLSKPEATTEQMLNFILHGLGVRGASAAKRGEGAIQSVAVAPTSRGRGSKRRTA